MILVHEILITFNPAAVLKPYKTYLILLSGSFIAYKCIFFFSVLIVHINV